MPEHSLSRAPQLKDVAVESGVSIPTVSRVLNGVSRVSDEKRERVLEAVRKLNYVPNASARSLATGTRNVVAVMASNTVQYGYASTIGGIEEAAGVSNYAVLINVIKGGSREQARESVNAVLAQSVAGIIILEFDDTARAALAAIPPHIRVVCVGSTEPSRPDLPHASIDDFAGAERATQHLLDLGHGQVHYIAIPNAGESDTRRRGWESALIQAGITPPEQHQASWEPESGFEIGEQLARDVSITAVLSGNDDLAVAVMRALRENGRRVPEDVSIIGFDDIPLARYWMPSLTTVRQDFFDLGRRAFALMQNVLSGQATLEASSIAPVLIERESVSRRA